MPNSEPELLYWDTDVLLSFINAAAGRVENTRALLADADKGIVRIVTSTFSVTEVAFAAHEKQNAALDAAVEVEIRSLWTPPSPIGLIDYHMGIAQRSRDLIRESVTRKWKLKPGDAVHLATAESVGAAKLQTCNLTDFQKWKTVIGMTVENPTSANPQMV